MLNNQNNAVELWAQKVDNAPKFPMSQEDCKDYIKILAAAEVIDADPQVIKELESKKLGMASMFWLRVKYTHTYTIKPSVAFLVSVIADRPGIAVMISNYLQFKAFKARVKCVDVKFFSTNCFPDGFPSEEVWHQLWLEQKVKDESGSLVNLLDNAANQESIIIK